MGHPSETLSFPAEQSPHPVILRGAKRSRRISCSSLPGRFCDCAQNDKCLRRRGSIQFHRVNGGFTLIEVLLALALTATLLALLSAAVFLVASDWNRDSDRLDGDLENSLALLQIDRALHGAFPHSWLDEESLTRLVYFSGESEALSWVSTVSPQQRPGLAAWQLYNDEEQGVALKLAPAFTDHPEERFEEAEASLLLPGYRADFQYLYTELDESRQWIDEWHGEERQELPLAVHILFEPLDEAGDQDEPLEILARIRNSRHRSIQPNVGLQGLLQ